MKMAQVKMVDPVDSVRLFCVEPNQKNKGLLISSTLVSGKKESPVQIINDLDQFVELKLGHVVGIATEIDDVVLVSEDDESDGSKQADSVTPTTPPECDPSEHIKSEVAQSDFSKQADLHSTSSIMKSPLTKNWL